MDKTNFVESKKKISRLMALLQSFLKLPIIHWFIEKGYYQGIFWFLMIGVVSSSNDVFMRFLGERLHTVEIVFFRFLFSAIAVIPFMATKGMKLFKTEQPMMHVGRAVIGALALAFCCHAVNVMPLAENTAIMFSIPLFFLPMALFFLKEKIDRPRWIATIIGFLGLTVIIQPGMDAFQFDVIFPLMAAILFAFMNIMAKKMIKDEHTYTLLFYFGLGSTLITLPFLMFIWQKPTLREMFLLLALGLGANLIQVCLFKAYSSVKDTSSLSAFGYTEFFVSTFFGYVFFNQIPKINAIFGTVLVVGSTLYMTVMESRKNRSKDSPS